MGDERFELTEELLQRYYDGELGPEQRAGVESALKEDSRSAARLNEYRKLGSMLRTAADRSAPDELAVRRGWEAIESQLHQSPSRTGVRKHAPWLAAVSAAAAILLYVSPFNIVPTAMADNELDIESIDCNYASFMLLQPEEENGHTIIWINDPESGE